MAGNRKRTRPIQVKKKLTGKNVLVGYELGTGKVVPMEPHHVLIVGTTRKAGKTTAAEGISSRFPGVKVVAFTTKRGEEVFSNGFNELPVFWKEPDPPLWLYLENMFAATLQTKQISIIRTTLIEFTKTTRTLDDAWKSVKRGLETDKLPDGRKLSAFDRSMLTQIDAYFDIAMPQLRAIKFVDKLALKPGVNVMSLIGYKEEVQAMIIGAVCKEIEQRDQDTLTIIPEAWKFVPSGKNSPAKAAIDSLMRQGLVLRNYVMLDSQSLLVDTTVRQLCDNYLIGKLGRESNEVDRAMEVLEGFGIKPTDIKNQKVGQFYVLSNDVVRHTYVMPAWMTEEDAQTVAKDYSTLPAIAKKYGIEITASAEDVEVRAGSHVAPKVRHEGPANEKLVKDLADLRQLYDHVVEEKDGLQTKLSQVESQVTTLTGSLNEANARLALVDRFTDGFVALLGPRLGQVQTISTATSDHAKRQRASQPVASAASTIHPKTVPEWIEKLYQEGFFATERTTAEVIQQIKEGGFNFDWSGVSHRLRKRVQDGMLSRKQKGSDYVYMQKRPYQPS